MNNEDYDIILDDPDVKLHRVYDYLPYSSHRIKQILRDYYGVRIDCVQAYKEGRYSGYKQRYYIYDIETGKLIKKDVHLDDFRRIFAHEDFPLHEDNSRNPKATQFLAIVAAITAQQTAES